MRTLPHCDAHWFSDSSCVACSALAETWLAQTETCADCHGEGYPRDRHGYPIMSGAYCARCDGDGRIATLFSTCASPSENSGISSLENGGDSDTLRAETESGNE